MASTCISSMILFLFLVAHPCNTQKLHYTENEPIYAKVNSLTSVDSLIPLDYYSLPFCKPSIGVSSNSRNLIQFLSGEKIQNSPYRFRVNTNESLYLCTWSKLTKLDVDLLRRTADRFYHASLILHDLPVVRSHGQEWLHQLQPTGFPVAYHGFPLYVHYIMNHLKFKVLVHETKVRDSSYYAIVGFEVSPCSVKRDVDAMSKLNIYDSLSPAEYCNGPRNGRQEIEENEIITFTYEVEFQVSNLTWESRWDAYLGKKRDVSYKSLLIQSVLLIFTFAGLISFDISRRRPKVKEEQQPLISDKPSRSKLFLKVAFRESGCSKMLCIMVGNGIQVAGMAIVTIVFAALGFFKFPIFLEIVSTMIILYSLFGTVACYVSVRMWRTIEGNSESWKSISWATSCFFSCILFAFFSVLNIIHYVNESTAAISVSLYFTILGLWLGVLVPFNFLGGFLASRRGKTLENPMKITDGIRERLLITMLDALTAGYITSGLLHVELSYIFWSIFRGRFYSDFDCLLESVLLFVITCAGVSTWGGYMCIKTGDWNWGWKSFLASGSSGVYVFAYSIKYLLFDLKGLNGTGLNGTASAALYVGYSTIFAVAVMISTGAVGFVAALVFLRFLAFFEKL